MTQNSLTEEQRLFSTHWSGAFVVACPGAGKTRTVVARIAGISSKLPPRKGVAVLSFTNTTVEEFIRRCHANGIDSVLKHPGYVGTFDAFLRQFFIAPGGIVGVGKRAIVVDSWETLGIEIRLSGDDSFKGPGVSLDKFDAVTNTINPLAIGHKGLREHVIAHLARYQQMASYRRQGLRKSGQLSAADARVEVLQRLKQPSWSDALGRALAARFHEIIVDEAQDCNELDLQIIRWLKYHGVSVTIVADPDQAIYGFRQGDSGQLLAFAEAYEPGDRLSLTGNFRSSPPICALAATLRGRSASDVSLGDTAAINIPVQIVAFSGASIPKRIAERFTELVKKYDINPLNAVVLSHGRRVARQACGLAPSSDAGGDSKVAQIARAVGSFWSSSVSNRARDAALRTIERMILDMMGKITDGESPAHAAERNAIDLRWLRRTALDIISRLPKTCEDNDAARLQWVTALRSEVARQGLAYRERTSPANYFRCPVITLWSRDLQGLEIQEIRHSTIHEAKGKEYDAVCVIVPPDRSGTGNTSRLLDAWERRADDEAKRVVYVGVTRAMKLLVLVIPSSFGARVSGILELGGVSAEVSDL